MKEKDRYSSSLAQIKELASRAGVDKQFLFATTLERYEALLTILDRITEELAKEPVMVTKQYGSSENVYSNPLLREYRSVCGQADTTANTLMRIIKSFASAGLADAFAGEEDEL